MKILSIDQSTTCTGYALFENNELIFYDKIKPGGSDFVIKLMNILSSLEKIIQKERPDKIVFENIQNQASKNIETFKKLSGLFYCLTLLCEKYQIDYNTYYASEWRKIIGFKGRMTRSELKQKSKALIKDKYGVDVIDDISDAILIGLADIERNKCAF